MMANAAANAHENVSSDTPAGDAATSMSDFDTGPETQSWQRPNVFVVGDAKCGTTSLHRLFELAPAIGTARTRKELHFFSAPELLRRVAGPGDETIPRAIVSDAATYRDEHAHLDRKLKVIADVSPSYLQNPPAAARIHAFAPEARIVILLREPAAKVFSQYVHLWSESRETLPFEQAYAQSAERREAGYSDMFDYEAGGRYAQAVERYLGLFGADRVCVILFEDMVRDMGAVRVRLEAFLGVALPSGELPRMNMGGRPKPGLASWVLGNEKLKAALGRMMPLGLRTRLSGLLRSRVGVDKPVLEPAMQTRLRAHYAADVRQLEALLGRKTGWPAQ